MTQRELALAGLALSEGRALIIAANKVNGINLMELITSKTMLAYTTHLSHQYKSLNTNSRLPRAAASD